MSIIHSNTVRTQYVIGEPCTEYWGDRARIILTQYVDGVYTLRLEDTSSIISRRLSKDELYDLYILFGTLVDTV